ncbi:MAG: hypothetical protein DI630_32080 [Gordonia sp. (in: high G+C Gram-positive bacteria)]|nr:MAG: hypothetical protein DI630_32080 [Gordonia sp. (in: high G+C Gram-positive bacteria)]
MSETTLYDRKGRPVAYVVEDGAIYLWTGQAVCYIESDRLYGWNGRHLGWFKDGVLYDGRGLRMGFTRAKCPSATYAEPAKYAKYARYAKYAKYAAHAQRPLSTSSSDQDLKDFLQSGKS